MRGQFVFELEDGKEIVVPNTVTDEGEESYLKMLFQGDNTIVAAGGNFFVGLCDQVPNEIDTLAAIASEPSGAGGYARIAIERNTVGWPTINTVNGRKRIISKSVVFTATGVDFSTAFSRAFLCDVVSGSVGTLFSYSGALTQALLLTAGNSFTMRYEVFLD